MVGSATLTDTGHLTGGYNISGGTISFTLKGTNGNPVTSPATDATMTVTAAGNYTTPIGVPATVVGNYVLDRQLQRRQRQPGGGRTEHRARRSPRR